MHLAEEMVAPRQIVRSKNELESGSPAQMRTPRMRPFEPSGNVPILRKTDSNPRPIFDLRSLHFFLNSQRHKSDYHFSFFKRSNELLQIHRQRQQQYSVTYAMKSNKCRKRYSRNWKVPAAHT